MVHGSKQPKGGMKHSSNERIAWRIQCPCLSKCSIKNMVAIHQSNFFPCQHNIPNERQFIYAHKGILFHSQHFKYVTNGNKPNVLI